MNLIQHTLEKAEQLLRHDDELAAETFMQLLESPEAAAFASYRLGEISNRLNEPIIAYAYHTKAYEIDAGFSRIIVKEGHPSSTYTYRKPDREVIVNLCPLCGGEGVPYAAYNVTTSLDFIPGFDPIRLWLHCPDCHHLFAGRYPHNLSELLTGTAFEFNLKPKMHLLSQLGPVLMEISRHAPGSRLLEVGVGAGEFSAVAKEYMFDVTGLDIRPPYAQAVSNMLNIPVHQIDFQLFETDVLFDVIVMGDVIEHMADPAGAIRKASEMLGDRGVLWISTPNFESAYSTIMKDLDPMWRIVEHLNYFSFRSLRKVLEQLGFDVVDYRPSGHYNGSMEVMSVKRG